MQFLLPLFSYTSSGPCGSHPPSLQATILSVLPRHMRAATVNCEVSSVAQCAVSTPLYLFISLISNWALSRKRKQRHRIKSWLHLAPLQTTARIWHSFITDAQSRSREVSTPTSTPHLSLLRVPALTKYVPLRFCSLSFTCSTPNFRHILQLLTHSIRGTSVVGLGEPSASGLCKEESLRFCPFLHLTCAYQMLTPLVAREER